MSLYQIWILQESGTCLFHRKYCHTKNDENLISGFLSAVHSFVGSFGAQIKWIETDQIRFVFQINDGLIFVACTSSDERAQLTYKRLSRVSEQFTILFGKDILSSGDPIPLDVFKSIAPSINRIFGLSECSGESAIQASSDNSLDFSFASPEARLMSFIRYRRKVSINEILRSLRLSDDEAIKAINQLEQKKMILRTENPDGTEQFGLSPVIKRFF
ncbi:MAG: hypothetical protein GF308_14255 [Candidatus Heimdallarchaeota archaeon]|nr:hypothetical protein [Candidatus Heimdallarchaeota archaeon]